MDIIIANRIGLLLAFLAGFLLAPELIGEKNLNRFEEWLKRISKKVAKFVQNIRKEGLENLEKDDIKKNNIDPKLYGFAYSAKVLLSFYFIPLAAGTVGLILITNRIIWFILLPFVLISWFCYIMILFWGVALLLLRLFRRNNRIKRWMLVLGLFMYIIGNILQFLATF